MNVDATDGRPPPRPRSSTSTSTSTSTYDSSHSELLVRNLQRRHAVDRRELGEFLRTVANAVGAGDRTATLALVSDAHIQRLNREYRGIDKPTDVLSFGGEREPSENSGAGPDVGERFQPPYLGDIVISVQTAERQARRRGGGLALELKVLALHGFLHLLGYDHEIDDGEMRRVEYRLRRRFGITRPRGSRRHECRTPSRNPGERRRPL